MRPGNVGLKGVEPCSDFTKFGLSSCGCKPRPVKAEPGRPVVSLAAGVATHSLMRRQAKVWVERNQPRNSVIPNAQGFCPLEGNSIVPGKGRSGEPRLVGGPCVGDAVHRGRFSGRGDDAFGGARDFGTHQEDDPATWDTQALHGNIRGIRSAR